MESMYLEIHQRPDGHATVRIPEGGEVREVDLGFMPQAKYGSVNLYEIIRRAFLAGCEHGAYVSAERTIKLPKWFRRKLK